MIAEWQLATPKTRFSLPIADCRLTIEKALSQFPALSISNRQSKMGNFRHPGPNHDRRDLMVDRLHFVS
jgi:hypothetical protein